MAVYVANEKKCHFTRKTTVPGILNNGCEAKPSTVYVKQYSGNIHQPFLCNMQKIHVQAAWKIQNYLISKNSGFAKNTIDEFITFCWLG